MNQDPLIKITASAPEVCASFDAAEGIRKLLYEGMAPREFAGVLLDNKKGVEAIDFMAHALPVRAGIWWGLLCMRHALGDDLAAPDRAAATAAVRWLMEPSEERRAAAKSAGTDAGSLSPAGAVAMAVGATGGSVYPPELPFKPPPPFAAHRAVARAVKLASIQGRPIRKVQRAYVELALSVAEGHLT